MNLIRLVLLASLSVAIPACGKVVPIDATGDGGNSTDGGNDSPDASVAEACDAPIEFEDLNECFIRAQCEQMVRCSSIFLDQDECETNLPLLSDDFAGQLVKVAQAEAAGTAEYDPNAAATCLDSFASRSCDSNGDGDDCELVFRGTTPENGSCIEEFECGEIGSNCEASGCNDQCCLGSCVSPANIGESCNFRSCKPGDECVRGEGEGGGGNDFTCQSGDIGSPCGDAFECDADLFCSQENLQCAPRRPVGAMCADRQECAGDADCISGTCAEVNEVGAACVTQCLGGLACNNGRCVELAGQGESCSDTECNSFLLTCFGPASTEVCVAKRELGETCSQRACMPGLVCQDDLPLPPPPIPTCVSPLPEGSPCDSGQHCTTGFCDFGNGTLPPVCHTPINCYTD